ADCGVEVVAADRAHHAPTDGRCSGATHPHRAAGGRRMNRHEILKKHHDALEAALVEKRPEIVSWFELVKAVPQEAPSEEVMDGLAQKTLLALLKAKL